MPVIPMMNQNQVLNTSSPVPIGNADNTMTDAMTAMGKGMVTLGNELDRVQKAQRDKVNRDTVSIAVEDYKASQMRVVKSEEVYGTNKSLTGLEADDAVRKIGDDRKKMMLDNSSFDQAQQMMFISATKNVDNDFAPAVMKNSSERSTKEYEAASQTLLLAMGKNVVDGVTSFPEAMVKIEEDIMSNPTIRDRPGAILGKQKELVAQIWQTHRATGTLEGVNRAMNFLNSNREFYTAEEYGKEMNAMRSDKTEIVNLRTAMDAREDRERTKREQENKDAALTVLFAEKKANNGNYVKETLTNDKAMGLLLHGTIDNEQYKAFQSWKPSDVQVRDDLQAARIRYESYIKGTFQRGMEEARALRQRGKLDPGTEAELQTELGKMLNMSRNRGADRRWDLSRDVFKNALEGINQNPQLDGSEKARARDTVLRDMMTALSKGDAEVPTLNKISDRLTQQFGTRGSFTAPNVSKPMQLGTRKSTELEREAVRMNGELKRHKAGSPEYNRLKDGLLDLGKRIKTLRIDENVNGGSDANRPNNARGLRR